MTLHAIVIGCGLLGSAAVMALCGPRFGKLVASLHLVDPATVRELTLLSVPEYAGSLRQSKAAAAARFARERLPPSTRVHCHAAFLQAVDFKQLLASLPTKVDDLVAVVLTPDSWPARVDALWQLRLASDSAVARIAVVQMGVDRSLLQISTFGNHLSDPCVVCGLASATLPVSEPCMVLRPQGQLLRGPLRAERQLAVSLFGEVLDRLIANPAGALNRKLLLRLADPFGAAGRFEHPIERRADCWGPHSAEAAPISLDELLRL